MTKNNNRVCCLYRVSTDKQVDFNSMESLFNGFTY